MKRLIISLIVLLLLTLPTAGTALAVGPPDGKPPLELPAFRACQAPIPGFCTVRP